MQLNKKTFNMKKVLFVVCAGILMTSCCATRIAAPNNKTVVLAKDNEVLDCRYDKKNWFFLSIVPLTKGKVAQTINEKNLSRVRVTTKVDALDIIISSILSPLGISTTTSVIEGNVSKY